MSNPTPGTYYKDGQTKVAKYADEAVWLVYTGWTQDPNGPIISGNEAEWGTRSGTLTILSGIDYHQVTRGTDLTLEPVGNGEMAVDVLGEGLVEIEGATWQTDPLYAPGTVVFCHFPAGWKAYAVGSAPPPPPKIQVTSIEPTWNDGPNTADIPVVEGGRYEIDGVEVTGTTGSFPQGDVLVTFEITDPEVYELAPGSETEFPHTFPAPTAPPLDFDDVADLQNWYKSTTGVTITGQGVSQWNDIGPPAANQHLVQATDANRPGTITLDGKTWIQFNANTDSLAKTSISAPSNTRENTVAMVIRSEHINGGGVAGLPASVIGALGFSAESITDEPLHVRLPNSATNIKVENIAAENARLFIMYTIPLADPGVANLWVGNLDSGTLQNVSGSVSVAALVHLFVFGSAARGSVAELGIWSTLKGQAEADGLFEGAKVNWGTP